MSRLSRTAVTALAGVLAGTLAASGAADLTPTQSTPASMLGNAENGRTLIEQTGCGTCHVIPGVDGARGLVGPPLDGIGSRQYLAGMLHNTPASMVLWLRYPQKVVPGNVMPDMGLSEDQARDIAAYLYSLK